MVYGRYTYSIHGVYKPTNITAGHHPVSMKGNYETLGLWGSGLYYTGMFTPNWSGISYNCQVHPI